LYYEATSIEAEEFITIKVLEDKREGQSPEKVFADISRGDGVWSSGKVKISAVGEVIEVQLQKGKLNAYLVSLYDEKGNLLECEPSTFKILGSGKGCGAVLPYNIGIEAKNKITGK